MFPPAGEGEANLKYQIFAVPVNGFKAQAAQGCGGVVLGQVELSRPQHARTSLTDAAQ
ncbi:MAG: hypothetical protein V9F04_16705 [Dermatophilaceae bacterium]